jgi:rare lipoprotein A
MDYRDVIKAKTVLISACTTKILCALNSDVQLQVNVRLTQTEGDCVLLKLSRLLWMVVFVGGLVAVSNDRAEATTGLASWYGPGFAGAPTASGEVFDPSAFTAAHKTLPFGTQLTVSYRGRSTQVTVNDRGPYTGGRDLDLSQGAAEYLGLTRAGVDYVDYTVTGRGGYGARQAARAARQAAGHEAARRSAADTRAQTRDYRVNRHAGWRNAASRADAGGGSYYVVRPGDTMWGISAQLGTTVYGLAAANGIANPDVISVGQRIYY